jgi:hypothetical protein
LRVFAVLSAVYVGGVHLGLAEDRYREARYVGGVFVAAALVLIIGAAVGAGGQRFSRGVLVAAWTLTALTTLLLLVGFLLSRTVGLPHFHRGDWPAELVLALPLEAAYAAAAAWALRRIVATRG